MDKSKHDKGTSRRDFLKTSLFAGAGTLLTGGIVAAFNATASGQKVKLLAQDGSIVEVNKEHVMKVGKETEEYLQQQGREGITGKKWVMVIDLGKCQNAQRCMAACQDEHGLWTSKDGTGDRTQNHMQVLEMKRESGAGFFMPKPCQHCDNPPCTKVCPVDATFKRQDGIVLIDNERCIGCRFCMAACPYSARVFNWNDPKPVPKQHEGKEYNVELNVPQKRGTITKCLFSADKLREGRLPSCVSACGNEVYWFGDQNEDAVTNGTTGETVRLSKLLEDGAAYTLLPELGTKPSVYYLPERNRVKPFVSAKKEVPEGEEHE